MRNQKILLALLIIFLITGCRPVNEQGNGMSEMQIKAAGDSITVIDSLVLTNRLKNTDLTNALARRSLIHARVIGKDDAFLKAYNIIGNAWSLSRMDSAFFYYSKALGMKPGKTHYPEKPMILYNLAMLYVAASNPKNAIILLDSAMWEAGKMKKFNVVSNALNSLGNIYKDLGNDSVARIMYDSAFQIANIHQLSLQMGVSLGSIALLEVDPKVGNAMERRAIQYLNHSKDGAMPLASIYINAGLKMTNPDSAIIAYLMAIRLINKETPTLTLLAAYNNLVYSYLEKGDIVQARQYLLNFAFPMAKKIRDDAWMANLYDTYADVLIAEGKFKEAIGYEKQSIALSGQANKQAADKEVRLLGAMLDLKNKNLIIVEKEQQIILRNARINSLKFWLAFAGFLILFLAFGYFWMRQRTRNKLQYLKLESAIKILEAEEHEKEKNGMELHDSVGMLCLKINETFEQQPSADVGIKKAIDLHIANFTDEVRNLSHRMSKKIMERHAIGPLLINLCEETAKYGKLKLQFDIGDPATEIPVQCTMHVYRIVQELLNNARKYASEANITLSVKFADKAVEIEYNDDGPGFNPDAESKKGMGLSNIFARVNLLNGTIELDTVPEHGVYWKISAPFQSPPNSL